MKYDQSAINKIAAESQRQGCVTQEIFDAVKHVAYSKLSKSPVTQEHYDAYIALTIAEAFRFWSHEKGGAFTMHVYNLISRYILEYDRKESRTVALALTDVNKITGDGRTYGEIKDMYGMSHPDTIVDDYGNVGGLWSKYLADAEIKDEDMEEQKELLNIVVAELDEKDAKLYRYKFFLEYSNEEIADIYKVSRSSIGVRVNALIEKIRLKVWKLVRQIN